jgi:hypothetical protein
VFVQGGGEASRRFAGDGVQVVAVLDGSDA